MKINTVLASFLLISFTLLMCLSSCKNDSKKSVKSMENSKTIVEKKKKKSTRPKSSVITAQSSDNSIRVTSKNSTPPKKVEPATNNSKPKVKKVNIPAKKSTPSKANKPKTNISNSNTKIKIDSTPNKKTSKVAAIEFTKRKWDFGTITEGDVVEQEFKFKNTGDIPLEIFSATATCGCTRPSFPFIAIPPGKTGIIGVKYDSVGKDGDQSPSITIKANTYPQIMTLYLNGTVVPRTKEEMEKYKKEQKEKSIKINIIKNDSI
ncbi:MAG: DUF1573 domain-containing protein [Saprospiraceae bacterium]